MIKRLFLIFNIIILSYISGCGNSSSDTPVTMISGESERSVMIDSTKTVNDIYSVRVNIPLDYLYSRENNIGLDIEFPRPSGWKVNCEKDYIDYYLSEGTDYKWEIWYKKSDMETGSPVCTVAVNDILKIGLYEDGDMVETHFYRILSEDITDNRLNIFLDEL